MPRRPQAANRGFILGYALTALFLLSLTMALLSRMSSSGNSGRIMASNRDELAQQISLIRSELLACTVSYPGGDNGLGFRAAWPAPPVSTLVADVLCPGNPNTTKSIWDPSAGLHAPRTLQGFTPWSYMHDVSSVRITISATSGGAMSTATLNNVALRFGSQATVNGATLTVVIAN